MNHVQKMQHLSVWGTHIELQANLTIQYLITIITNLFLVFSHSSVGARSRKVELERIMQSL